MILAESKALMNGLDDMDLGPFFHRGWNYLLHGLDSSGFHAAI